MMELSHFSLPLSSGEGIPASRLIKNEKWRKGTYRNLGKGELLWCRTNSFAYHSDEHVTHRYVRTSTKDGGLTQRFSCVALSAMIIPVLNLALGSSHNGTFCAGIHRAIP
jgi:hypothetical protein